MCLCAGAERPLALQHTWDPFTDASPPHRHRHRYYHRGSHIDMAELLSLLPNLARLEVAYGVNKIGMNYERMLFGMKIADATALAKVGRISL